jgi:hypothetical protein
MIESAKLCANVISVHRMRKIEELHAYTTYYIFGTVRVYTYLEPYALFTRIRNRTHIHIHIHIWTCTRVHVFGTVRINTNSEPYEYTIHTCTRNRSHHTYKLTLVLSITFLKLSRIKMNGCLSCFAI